MSLKNLFQSFMLNKTENLLICHSENTDVKEKL